MKKIISAIIILIMVLPLTYIYAVGDLNKRILSSATYTETTGVEEIKISTGQDQTLTTYSDMLSDKTRIFYKDIYHKTDIVSSVQIIDKGTVSGQWGLSDEERALIATGADFEKSVLKFRVKNNTRDGFVVGWFNADDEITSDLSTGIPNYCMVPKNTKDGEALIPYTVKFKLDNQDQPWGLAASSLKPGTDSTKKIKLKIGEADKTFQVILNGVGNAHNQAALLGNQEKTDSTITVSFDFNNPSALLFSGEYKTKNYLAVVDL